MNPATTRTSPHDLAAQSLALLSEVAFADRLRAAAAIEPHDEEAAVGRARARLGVELLPELERELLAVHRAEQATLLAEACELRLSNTAGGRLVAAARPVDLADWRRRCAQEVELALAGDAEVAGDLLACGILEPIDWPAASELARAAAELEPGVGAELRLGRALAADGRYPEARRRLAALDASLLPLAAQQEGLRLRAELDLACGAFAGALRRLRRALALGRGPEPSLALLALAEELGAAEERELARERLAGGLEGAAAARRALSELVERRRLLGRPLALPVRRGLEREVAALAPRTSARGRS
jgi:hypothetical protein